MQSTTPMRTCSVRNLRGGLYTFGANFRGGLYIQTPSLRAVDIASYDLHEVKRRTGCARTYVRLSPHCGVASLRDEESVVLLSHQVCSLRR
jgi:hypothetical protein